MQIQQTTPKVLIPPPDRFGLEREVRQLLPPKSIKKIAQLTNRDKTLVSVSYNPNREDRHNPVYMFVLNVYALDQIRTDLGDAVLSLVNRERRKWLKTTDCPPVHPAVLTKSIGAEYIEAIEKEMSGSTLDVKIKEYTDLKNAVDKKLDALNAERQRAFGGEITTETRETVRGLIKNRRGA